MTFQINFSRGIFSSACSLEKGQRERERKTTRRQQPGWRTRTSFVTSKVLYVCVGRENEAISKSISFYKRCRCQRQNAPLVARKPPLCDRALTKTNTALVPGDPQDVRVKSINSTSVRVDWRPPLDKERNGLIRGYHVHVQEIKDEVRENENEPYSSV